VLQSIKAQDPKMRWAGAARKKCKEAGRLLANQVSNALVTIRQLVDGARQNFVPVVDSLMSSSQPSHRPRRASSDDRGDSGVQPVVVGQF
jgi:hypothetical protein